MALMKKRKSMDQNNNKRNTHSISTRRNAHSSTQIEENQNEEPENKRQRVVHFEEDNRRQMISIKMKAKIHKKYVIVVESYASI